jgi:hypothetical protein
MAKLACLQRRPWLPKPVARHPLEFRPLSEGRFLLRATNDRHLRPRGGNSALSFPCVHLPTNPVDKVNLTSLAQRGSESSMTAKFVSKFGTIAHRAKRVAEADEPVHFFFQRHMAADAATHTFANQDRGDALVFLPRLSQRLPMRRDQSWQGIGALPLFAHIGVIEGLDLTDRRQMSFPALHPRMR